MQDYAEPEVKSAQGGEMKNLLFLDLPSRRTFAGSSATKTARLWAGTLVVIAVLAFAGSALIEAAAGLTLQRVPSSALENDGASIVALTRAAPETIAMPLQTWEKAHTRNYSLERNGNQVLLVSLCGATPNVVAFSSKRQPTRVLLGLLFVRHPILVDGIGLPAANYGLWLVATDDSHAGGLSVFLARDVSGAETRVPLGSAVAVKSNKVESDLSLDGDALVLRIQDVRVQIKESL